MAGIGAEDIDSSWWAEKTEQVAVGYCPACEPDVDPTKECVVISYCKAHKVGVAGSADDLVRPPYVHPVTDSVGDEPA